MPGPAMLQRRGGANSRGHSSSSASNDAKQPCSGADLEYLYTRGRKSSKSNSGGESQSVSKPAPGGNSSDSSVSKKDSTDAVKSTPPPRTTVNTRSYSTKPTSGARNLDISEPRPRTKVSNKRASFQYPVSSAWEYNVEDDEELNGGGDKDAYTLTLRFEVAPEFDLQAAGGCLYPPLSMPPPPPSVPPVLPPRLSQTYQQQPAMTGEEIFYDASNCLSSYGAGVSATTPYNTNYTNNNTLAGNALSGGFNQSNCFGSNPLNDFYSQQQQQAGGQYQANNVMMSSPLGSYGALNYGSQSFGYGMPQTANNIGSYGANNFSNAFNYSMQANNNDANNSLGYYNGYNNNTANYNNAYNNYPGYSNNQYSSLDDYMGFTASPASYGSAGFNTGTGGMNNYGYSSNHPRSDPNMYSAGNYTPNNTGYNYSYQTSMPPIYCQRQDPASSGYLGSFDQMKASAQVNPYNTNACFQASLPPPSSSNQPQSFTCTFEASFPKSRSIAEQIVNGGGCENYHNNYGPYNELITVPYGTGNIFVNELLKRRHYNTDQFYGFNPKTLSGICQCCCSSSAPLFQQQFAQPQQQPFRSFASNLYNDPMHRTLMRSGQGRARTQARAWRTTACSPYVNFSISGVRCSPLVF